MTQPTRRLILKRRKALPDHMEEIDGILKLFADRGYTASPEEIEEAYHDYCEGQVCASWVSLNCWKMDVVIEELLAYFEEPTK